MHGAPHVCHAITKIFEIEKIKTKKCRDMVSGRLLDCEAVPPADYLRRAYDGSIAKPASTFRSDPA